VPVESGGDSTRGRRAVKDLLGGLAVTAHISHHGGARRNPATRGGQTVSYSEVPCTAGPGWSWNLPGTL